MCDMYNRKIKYVYINLYHLTSFPSFRGITVQVYHIALHGGIAACQMGIGNQVLMGLHSGCLTKLMENQRVNNGDLPIKNCDFPKIVDLPIKNGKLENHHAING